MAEPHAEVHEPRTLRRSDLDPFGQLAPEDPVLGLEILDRLDEFFLGGASQEQEEGMDEPLHGNRLRKSLRERKVA
jgi:hypothetical protein